MKVEGMAVEEMNDGGQAENGAASDACSADDGGEFQLTIRKLELPVRPRGVLAE